MSLKSLVLGFLIIVAVGSALLEAFLKKISMSPWLFIGGFVIAVVYFLYQEWKDDEE